MRALDGQDTALPHEWVGRHVDHASFDDFFVQLPSHLASAHAASAWGQQLRRSVLQATGLRCSLGIARTKLLSVLATKRAKPDGLHCCIGHTSERELLDAARIDKICGASLNGLHPRLRANLLRCLGSNATLGCARTWLSRDAFAAAAELGDSETQALVSLLASACDGSQVGRFSLPRGLSVECSVRPTEYSAPSLCNTQNTKPKSCIKSRC